MFGRKTANSNRFIVAVKNYIVTFDALKNGKITLPYERGIYLKMLESQSSKVDSLKEIGKFAKTNKKSLKEVGHYWESLIANGYTLVNVEYAEKIPSIDHVCHNETIKFVCIA